jgi:tRNA dimethylallyltransferase
VIAGPTATGKTGLSLRLADVLAAGLDAAHVEIVSADSRQVYRGLDIGTAKASPADRARVRHHGLDVVDPDQAFTVADFAAHASAALAGLAERAAAAGRPPLGLLVGGTGLYLRAVARGLDTARLVRDADARERLEAELVARGLAPLAERLEAVAPSLAAETDLRNPRRVVRALEIASVVGDRPRPTFRGYPAPVSWLGLTADGDTHRRWIAERAAGQFAAGLLEEAAALRRRFDPGLPAFTAIGYREAWSVLDGERTLDAAIAEDARRNVAFARRQRTWFRSEPGIEWVEVGEAAPDPLGPAIAAARRLLQARSGAEGT